MGWKTDEDKGKIANLGVFWEGGMGEIVRSDAILRPIFQDSYIVRSAKFIGFCLLPTQSGECMVVLRSQSTNESTLIRRDCIPAYCNHHPKKSVRYVPV
jgi:hypothetical protein